MSDVASQLRTLRPQLVDRAARGLARAEGLRVMASHHVARFFELLQSAVESGNPEWLNPCLEEWVNSRSGSVFVEHLTFLPVLRALKRATWDVLRESASRDQALEIILALEPAFDHAWVYLSSLEAQALLEQSVAAVREARSNFIQLDKSKSAFISVAAHELKTPLSLIEGYASIFQEELSKERKQLADYVVVGFSKGIQRLKEIIEDMFDISMIDNDLLTLHYQPLDFNGLLQHVETKLRPSLEQRRLHLEITQSLGEAASATYADPIRLMQALMNVLHNAVKFTPDGGTISIGLRPLPGFVEIAIADTGIGIAPENLERIFSKFGSLGDISQHSTSKTNFKGGGLGLGLPIARGIIQAHGGTIWVDSPGYDETKCPGSTVHIMVPLLAEPPEEPQRIITPSALERPPIQLE